MLSSPLAGEELLIYLATSEQAVSVVLLREEAKAQSAQGRRGQYKHRKVGIYLAVSCEKFKMYLKDHQEVVMTDQPLKKILH